MAVRLKRSHLSFLVLLGVPLMFYSCVNSVIFVPPAPSYQMYSEIMTTPTANGQNIAVYYLPAAENNPVVLFSHGNGEDLGHNIEFAQGYRQQGFGILLYDYRGYGLSDGKPSENNTYQDIETAYRLLTGTFAIAPSRIIAHGRSVGCGPSTWLAEKHPLGGLILESPFVSAFRVVTRWPILPFDKYKNLARIKDIHCPVLVIHGTQDEIVPFWHGLKIFEAANEPKMNYWVPKAGHNDLFYQAGDSYWTTLNKFRTKILEQDTKEK